MNKTALTISILILIFVISLVAFLFIQPKITFLVVAGVVLLFLGCQVALKVYAEIDLWMFEAELGKYKEEK
ncbi:hypothetical protein PSC83_001114 [Listeria monocytogenes]|nr:hypothetical protein [Listeria monocytogenes]